VKPTLSNISCEIYETSILNFICNFYNLLNSSCKRKVPCLLETLKKQIIVVIKVYDFMKYLGSIWRSIIAMQEIWLTITFNHYITIEFMMGNTNVINAIVDLHKTSTSNIQMSLGGFNMF